MRKRSPKAGGQNPTRASSALLRMNSA